MIGPNSEEFRWKYFLKYFEKKMILLLKLTDCNENSNNPNPRKKAF